jgi:Zinc-binding dehydrogenase
VLEPNVKEEAKERMVAVHASPAKFPEQAKSSAARLRALVRILQSREEIPTGSPGPKEPGPFAVSNSQPGRAPQWELRMIEYAERAYSRAMKLAEVLVKSRSEEDKVLELIGATTLLDSLRCAKQGGIVCMTGMVGNKWSFDDFSPMDAIPTAVCLTTYDGGPEEFVSTPLEELAQQIAAGRLHAQIGKVFRLDEIVEAHRCMEENKAGGKIVVLV